MDAMAAEHKVHLLCIDDVQSSLLAARKTIVETGYPLRQLSVPGFRTDARFLRQLPYRRAIRRAIRVFLASEPIDVLVFGSDVSMVTRMLISQARSANIPSVLIPDGLVLPPNPDYRPPLSLNLRNELKTWVCRKVGLEGLRGESGVEMVLLYNDSARQAFIDRGIAPARVRAVGSPEYEALARTLRDTDQAEELRRSAKLRKSLGLKPDGPVAAFAHQPVATRRDLRQIARAMILAARACGGAAVVKFHPRSSESPQAWRDWARGQGFADDEIAFAKTECTSIDVVTLSTAVVTIFSTVGLEALICKKPLVLVQYLRVVSRLPYDEAYGAALGAVNPGQLQGLIVSALSDHQVQQQLKRNAEVAIDRELLGLDGKSTQRMKRAVLELIQASSDSPAPGGGSETEGREG